MFPRRSLEIIAAAALLGAAAGSSGCGDYTPPTTSPVVEADSEAAKKAQAEDEADRKLRREREAKAASRKKNLHLPEDG